MSATAGGAAASGGAAADAGPRTHPGACYVGGVALAHTPVSAGKLTARFKRPKNDVLPGPQPTVVSLDGGAHFVTTSLHNPPLQQQELEAHRASWGDTTALLATLYAGNYPEFEADFYDKWLDYVDTMDLPDVDTSVPKSELQIPASHCKQFLKHHVSAMTDKALVKIVTRREITIPQVFVALREWHRFENAFLPSPELQRCLEQDPTLYQRADGNNMTQRLLNNAEPFDCDLHIDATSISTCQQAYLHALSICDCSLAHTPGTTLTTDAPGATWRQCKARALAHRSYTERNKVHRRFVPRRETINKHANTVQPTSQPTIPQDRQAPWTVVEPEEPDALELCTGHVDLAEGRYYTHESLTCGAEFKALYDSVCAEQTTIEMQTLLDDEFYILSDEDLYEQERHQLQRTETAELNANEMACAGHSCAPFAPYGRLLTPKGPLNVLQHETVQAGKNKRCDQNSLTFALHFLNENNVSPYYFEPVSSEWSNAVEQNLCEILMRRQQGYGPATGDATYARNALSERCEGSYLQDQSLYCPVATAYKDQRYEGRPDKAKLNNVFVDYNEYRDILANMHKDRGSFRLAHVENEVGQDSAVLYGCSRAFQHQHVTQLLHDGMACLQDSATSEKRRKQLRRMTDTVMLQLIDRINAETQMFPIAGLAEDYNTDKREPGRFSNKATQWQTDFNSYLAYAQQAQSFDCRYSLTDTVHTGTFTYSAVKHTYARSGSVNTWTNGSIKQHGFCGTPTCLASVVQRRMPWWSAPVEIPLKDDVLAELLQKDNFCATFFNHSARLTRTHKQVMTWDIPVDAHGSLWIDKTGPEIKFQGRQHNLHAPLSALESCADKEQWNKSIVESWNTLPRMYSDTEQAILKDSGAVVTLSFNFVDQTFTYNDGRQSVHQIADMYDIVFALKGDRVLKLVSGSPRMYTVVDIAIDDSDSSTSDGSDGSDSESSSNSATWVVVLQTDEVDEPEPLEPTAFVQTTYRPWRVPASSPLRSLTRSFATMWAQHTQGQDVQVLAANAAQNMFNPFRSVQTTWNSSLPQHPDLTNHADLHSKTISEKAFANLPLLVRAESTYVTPRWYGLAGIRMIYDRELVPWESPRNEELDAWKQDHENMLHPQNVLKTIEDNISDWEGARSRPNADSSSSTISDLGSGSDSDSDTDSDADADLQSTSQSESTLDAKSRQLAVDTDRFIGGGSSSDLSDSDDDQGGAGAASTSGEAAAPASGAADAPARRAQRLQVGGKSARNAPVFKNTVCDEGFVRTLYTAKKIPYNHPPHEQELTESDYYQINRTHLCVDYEQQSKNNRLADQVTRSGSQTYEIGSMMQWLQRDVGLPHKQALKVEATVAHKCVQTTANLGVLGLRIVHMYVDSAFAADESWNQNSEAMKQQMQKLEVLLANLQHRFTAKSNDCALVTARSDVLLKGTDPSNSFDVFFDFLAAVMEPTAAQQTELFSIPFSAQDVLDILAGGDVHNWTRIRRTVRDMKHEHRCEARNVFMDVVHDTVNIGPENDTFHFEDTDTHSVEIPHKRYTLNELADTLQVLLRTNRYPFAISVNKKRQVKIACPKWGTVAGRGPLKINFGKSHSVLPTLGFTNTEPTILKGPKFVIESPSVDVNRLVSCEENYTPQTTHELMVMQAVEKLQLWSGRSCYDFTVDSGNTRNFRRFYKLQNRPFAQTSRENACFVSQLYNELTAMAQSCAATVKGCLEVYPLAGMFLRTMLLFKESESILPAKDHEMLCKLMCTGQPANSRQVLKKRTKNIRKHGLQAEVEADLHANATAQPVSLQTMYQNLYRDMAELNTRRDEARETQQQQQASAEQIETELANVNAALVRKYCDMATQTAQAHCTFGPMGLERLFIEDSDGRNAWNIMQNTAMGAQWRATTQTASYLCKLYRDVHVENCAPTQGMASALQVVKSKNPPQGDHLDEERERFVIDSDQAPLLQTSPTRDRGSSVAAVGRQLVNNWIYPHSKVRHLTNDDTPGVRSSLTSARAALQEQRIADISFAYYVLRKKRDEFANAFLVTSPCVCMPHARMLGRIARQTTRLAVLQQMWFCEDRLFCRTRKAQQLLTDQCNEVSTTFEAVNSLHCTSRYTFTTERQNEFDRTYNKTYVLSVPYIYRQTMQGAWSGPTGKQFHDSAIRARITELVPDDTIVAAQHATHKLLQLRYLISKEEALQPSQSLAVAVQHPDMWDSGRQQLPEQFHKFFATSMATSNTSSLLQIGPNLLSDAASDSDSESDDKLFFSLYEKQPLQCPSIPIAPSTAHQFYAKTPPPHIDVLPFVQSLQQHKYWQLCYSGDTVRSGVAMTVLLRNIHEAQDFETLQRSTRTAQETGNSYDAFLTFERPDSRQDTVHQTLLSHIVANLKHHIASNTCGSLCICGSVSQLSQSVWTERSNTHVNAIHIGREERENAVDAIVQTLVGHFDAIGHCSQSIPCNAVLLNYHLHLRAGPNVAAGTQSWQSYQNARASTDAEDYSKSSRVPNFAMDDKGVRLPCPVTNVAYSTTNVVRTMIPSSHPTSVFEHYQRYKNDMCDYQKFAAQFMQHGNSHTSPSVDYTWTLYDRVQSALARSLYNANNLKVCKHSWQIQQQSTSQQETRNTQADSTGAAASDEQDEDNAMFRNRFLHGRNSKAELPLVELVVAQAEPKYDVTAEWEAAGFANPSTRNRSGQESKRFLLVTAKHPHISICNSHLLQVMDETKEERFHTLNRHLGTCDLQTLLDGIALSGGVAQSTNITDFVYEHIQRHSAAMHTLPNAAMRVDTRCPSTTKILSKMKIFQSSREQRFSVGHVPMCRYYANSGVYKPILTSCLSQNNATQRATDTIIRQLVNDTCVTYDTQVDDAEIANRLYELAAALPFCLDRKEKAVSYAVRVVITVSECFDAKQQTRVSQLKACAEKVAAKVNSGVCIACKAPRGKEFCMEYKYQLDVHNYQQVEIFMKEQTDLNTTTDCLKLWVDNRATVATVVEIARQYFKNSQDDRLVLCKFGTGNRAALPAETQVSGNTRYLLQVNDGRTTQDVKSEILKKLFNYPVQLAVECTGKVDLQIEPDRTWLTDGSAVYNQIKATMDTAAELGISRVAYFKCNVTHVCLSYSNDVKQVEDYSDAKTALEQKAKLPKKVQVYTYRSPVALATGHLLRCDYTADVQEIPLDDIAIEDPSGNIVSDVATLFFERLSPLQQQVVHRQFRGSAHGYVVSKIATFLHANKQDLLVQCTGLQLSDLHTDVLTCCDMPLSSVKTCSRYAHECAMQKLYGPWEEQQLAHACLTSAEEQQTMHPFLRLHKYMTCFFFYGDFESDSQNFFMHSAYGQFVDALATISRENKNKPQNFAQIIEAYERVRNACGSSASILADLQAMCNFENWQETVHDCQLLCMAYDNAWKDTKNEFFKWIQEHAITTIGELAQYWPEPVGDGRPSPEQITRAGVELCELILSIPYEEVREHFDVLRTIVKNGNMVYRAHDTFCIPAEFDNVKRLFNLAYCRLCSAHTNFGTGSEWENQSFTYFPVRTYMLYLTAIDKDLSATMKSCMEDVRKHITALEQKTKAVNTMLLQPGQEALQCKRLSSEQKANLLHYCTGQQDPTHKLSTMQSEDNAVTAAALASASARCNLLSHNTEHYWKVYNFVRDNMFFNN